MILFIFISFIIILTFLFTIIKLINNFTYLSFTDPVQKLKKLYNNIDYDKYGIPKGGFLISMLNTNIICPNYTTAGINGLCDKVCNSKFDIGDINNLLSLVSKGINTTCLSLDTTYFRKDLSPYAFGPLPKGYNNSQDFVIGIIIDINKIWEYIACMYTIDSGTVGRYNSDTQNTGSFKICEKNNEKCWTDYLNSINSKYLGFAGCGIMSQSDDVRGLHKSANSFFVNRNRKFKVPDKKNIIGFGFSNQNIPFSKFQWKEWIKNVKKVNKLTRNKDYIDSQCHNNNGYRENEVDIIVPSSLPFKNKPPCTTTDDFKKIWLDSIIGIFTNAKTNCSKRTGSKCYRCDENGMCCCNENYHINVVKKLVKNFNENNNKNINGFIIDTLNINNFSSNTNLNISLID